MKKLFYLLCFSIGALLACTPDTSVNTYTSPKELSKDSKYTNTYITEYTYQGCEYIRIDGRLYSFWGGHKGNCKNHPQTSLNPEYIPDYQIIGVRTISEAPLVYSVTFKIEADTNVFVGNIEHCMTFGFDANEVIICSNL